MKEDLCNIIFQQLSKAVGMINKCTCYCTVDMNDIVIGVCEKSL